MLFLTFPKGSFPAGTAMAWPEPPDGDKQEHSAFSQHMRFGIPTQPVGMDARQVHRHANLAKHPCNTHVILFSPRPSGRVAAITPARVLHLTSVLHGILVPHPVRGDNTLSCGAGGRTRLLRCATWTFRLRPIWTPSGASGCARGSMMKTYWGGALR